MPSNIHDRITAPVAGFPESPTEAGPGLYYLGVLAHLDVDEPSVVLRFNGNPRDEVILRPGSTRIIGRGANRSIHSYQARSLGDGDATLTLEFTEDAPADALVWHSTGPAGPAGPQGAEGPAGAGAASIRVRAMVGGIPINIGAGASADLVADVEAFNVGAAYDAATGILTIPVGEVGDYLVMASVLSPDTPLELQTLVSSDGGNVWNTLSTSPRGENGARISDLLTLNDGTQLKFSVYNPSGAAVDVLGSVGNEARSYLNITKIA